MLFAASCTKPVEFTGEESSSMLVVNGIQKVGGKPNLIVERSYFFLTPSYDYSVAGLTVKLYVNDNFVEELSVFDTTITNEYAGTSYNATYCSGNYVYKYGDKVHFEIESKDYETASVTITMPEQPAEVPDFQFTHIENAQYFPSMEDCPECYPDVDENGDSCAIRQIMMWDDELQQYVMNIDTVHPGEFSSGNFYFTLLVNDNDKVQYYNLDPEARRMNFMTNDYVLQAIYSDLTTFENGASLMHSSENIFSDGYFKDQSHEFNFYVENYEPYGKEITFKVTLYAIDEHYYKFAKSYYQYESANGELGVLTYLMSEPTQVYSNVEGGIGVVCGISEGVDATIVITKEELTEKIFFDFF